ncbi:MAG TPA: FtsX-like permease family protein [Pirellulales bacterium]|jgi:putative ABC transport system permease protein
MIVWSFALRELLRRPGRSLLTLMSVMIAVAAIVAVTSATISSRKSYQQVFDALAGRADLEVVAKGGGRFPEDVMDTLAEVPGLVAIVPTFQCATTMYAKGNKARSLVVGIEPEEPESLFGFSLISGEFPSGLTEIALESSMAAGLQVKVGDEVRLLSSLGLRKHKVVGIVGLNSAVSLHQGGMVLASVSALQRMFRGADKVDSLRLYLKDPAKSKEVIAAATKLLPEELVVRLPSARSGVADEMLLLTEISLNLASAFSFTTAVFIALSVFLMSVQERRRQLSIMRAIGATRRQIIQFVCGEAFVVGLLGTLAGLPVGLYAAKILLHSMSVLLQADLPPTPDFTSALLIGGCLGPIICLVAAGYPAMKASEVSPLEGLRPVVTLPATTNNRKTTIAGVVGCVLTSFITYGSVRGLLPISISIMGAVSCLVSVVLLLPLVLSPCVRFLSRVLHRWLGFEGEMAERIILRRGGRSALTIGILVIAVTAGISTSNSVLSVTEDVSTWSRRTITADYLLRASMLDMTGQDTTSLPDSMGEEILKMPGVDHIETVRMVRIDAGGREAMLVARDLTRHTDTPLDLVGNANSTQVLQELRNGEAVLGSVLAERLKIHAGDTVHVTCGGLSHDLRVAAVTTEYLFGGMVVYLDQAVARKQFGIEGADSFLVTAKPNADLEAPLQEFARENALLVHSFSQLSKLIDVMTAGVTGGLWALLILGLLVGALGVVNTLTMNVLEQTRELSVMRATGMMRRQVIKTVMAQAIYLGVVGIAVGALWGVILSRMINLCLGSLCGRYVGFSPRFPEVGALLVIALAIVLLAAFLPGRRAANLHPVQAMRQE